MEIPNENVVRISVTKGCKVPSGIQYSNTDHSFTITVEHYYNDTMIDRKVVEEQIREKMSWAEGYLDSKVRRTFEDWENFRKQQDLRSDMYRVIDGKKVPRVTSIITPEIPPIPYLEDHAALGTKLDEMMKVYVETGIWAYDDFQDKGRIGVTWDEIYQAMSEWLEEFGDTFVFEKHSVSVINSEYNYCGELDALGYTGTDSVIFDFKKTKTLAGMKDKFFMQMAAYAKSLDFGPESMIIVSPFNPPEVSNEIDEYFDKFLQKRKEFKARYGL